MTSFEKIKSAIQAYEVARKEAMELVTSEFDACIKELVSKSNGAFSSFYWAQFTPWFNDGDSCTFSRNDTYFVVNLPEDEADNDYGDGGESNWSIQRSKSLTDEQKAVIQEINDFINSIDDEFYLEMFGDHVKVNVDAEGNIDVNSYDHD